MYLELATALIGSPIFRAVAVDVGAAIVSQSVQGLATGALKRRRCAEIAAPTVQAEPALRIVLSVEVVSATPGRVRLRISGLRGDRERADQLTRRLLGVRGVTAVRANPLTGAALVHYDPAVVGQVAVMQAAETPAEPSSGNRPAAARRSAPSLLVAHASA
jgi:hypothetical protein